MTMLLTLPTELLVDILRYALDSCEDPAELLLVNRTFYDTGLEVLYTHLRLRSITQLQRFAGRDVCCPHPPRTITVQLPGGAANTQLFVYLTAAFAKCSTAYWKRALANSDPNEAPFSAIRDGPVEPIPLDRLSLRMNSHTGDPNLSKVEDALSLVSPEVFSWTGPDPGHHFSHAIVAMAAVHVLNVIPRWTRIRDLTLTNISFIIFHPTTFGGISSLSLHPLKHLRFITFGKATYLDPEFVVNIVRDQLSLERFKVIDAYKESIWGQRVRKTDVEAAAIAAAMERGTDEVGLEGILERIRAVVSCEMQTERIVGGDRMDGSGTL